MNNKRRAEVLIGLILLLAMGCAALAFYAGDRKARHWGPRMLEQAASGEVWLVLDRDLFIASPAGVLRRQVPLADLNLPGPVNAIAPLPAPEGETRMLVGVIKSPEWLVMDGDGQVVERIVPSGVDVPFYETFHLAAAPDGRIAMGTGGDHRVLLFDARGKYLAQSEPGLFRFANGLWYENGQWWVVDTNHHRVSSLNGETLKLESSVPVPAVGGAYWPSLARRGKGVADSITVSVMRNGMQYGVVLDMSSSGKLLHEYRSQADNPQPTDFIWLDKHLLIAESDDYSLQLFDQGGKHLGSWGDANIIAALKDARGQRRLWSKVLLGAQAGAFVLGVLGVIGYFAWKRREESVPGTLPDDVFPRLATPWLSKKDELLEGFKLFWPLILLILGIAVIPQVLFLMVLHFAGGLKAAIHSTWFMPALVVVGVAFVAVIFWIAISASKIMRRRVHAPRFEAVLSSRWVKWSKRSKAVREELEEGENLQEILMVYTARLFPAFNMNVWALTDRRVLIFALGTGGRGKLLASVPRRQASASVESTTGWFWWTEAFGKIALRVADGRAFQGYPASPLTARRMADLLALAHGGPQAIPPCAPMLQTAAQSDSRALRPAQAFLLSLLLPGAAQMMQNRFILGLVLLTVMLVNVAFVLTPVLLAWIGHFYDVHWTSGLEPILFGATWALLSAWDAGNYARRVRGATISPRA